MNPRGIFFSLSLALPAALALAAAGPPPPRSTAAVVAELALFDRPAEAAEHFRVKRAPVGEREVPVERYVAALEAMREMPQHSTGLGRTLPSRAEMLAKGLDSAVDEAALGAWKWLGPGNVGGRTRALLVDPRRPQTMYAAGVSGGVFKSTDGGGRWAPLTDLLANLAVSSLAFDPRNPNIVYAGTGEGYGNLDALRGAGIFRSANAGRTWTRVPGTGTPDFHYVNDLAVSGKTGRVYAATLAGVFRGTLTGGGGAWRWEPILAPGLQGGCLDLALRPDRADDVLFASCGQHSQATVYRHTRAQAGGAGDWQVSLSVPGMARTSLALAPSNPDVLYALAAYAGPSQRGLPASGLFGVYRSTRGGEPGSWTVQLDARSADRLSASLLSYTVVTFLADCGLGDENADMGLAWYASTIAVDPVDPDRVWAGAVDLFRSDDGGRTWGLASYWWSHSFLGVLQPGPVPPSYLHADNHALVFDPRYDGRRNRTLYVGNDGGVFRTRDARAAVARGPRAACDARNSRVAWESLNRGYGVTQFYHGAPFPDGRSYAGGTQDNGTVLGRDAAGPDGWKTIWGSDGGHVLIDPTDPRIVYVASVGKSIKKSTDGGRSFADVSQDLRGFWSFIAPFAMDPNAPRHLWAGGDSLWRSTDGAATWQKASPLLLPGPTILPEGQVSTIAVAPGNSDRVLAGTTEGTIVRSDAALAADDRSTWLKSKPRAGWVSSVTHDPHRPGTAYATYATFGGTHVWKSTDGGATWSPLDGTGPPARRLPDLPVHALAVDPIRPGRLYVGTDLGVFVTTDGGATWAVEATGFANVVVEALAIQRSPQGSHLFAFTYGRGAYRVRL